MAAAVIVVQGTENVLRHKAPAIAEVECTDEQVPAGLSYGDAAREIIRSAGIEGVSPGQVDADLRDKYGPADVSTLVHINSVDGRAVSMGVGAC
jgi:hypothetical protein